MSNLFSCRSFIFAVYFLIFCLVESKGQVINDNIENRLELKLNEPRLSNTTDCTLQWKCLNHALTKKLIQYHNDQWFFFKSTTTEQLFINISGQDCRDLRGVQIMVIGGFACIPESYEILECISLGDQDDVFLKLDHLDTGQEYLVLIDGYLNDFCSFEIELSEIPKGFPIENSGLVPMELVPISDLHLEIFWSVPDSISNLVRQYEIFRKDDLAFNSLLIHEIPQGFNAKGAPRLDYVVEDILPDFGAYYYKIIGIGDMDRFLIAKRLLSYNRPPRYKADSISSLTNTDSSASKMENIQSWLEVDLHYPRACKLKISIYNASSQSLLKQFYFNYNPSNRLIKTNIKEFEEKGIFYYRVEVANEESGEKKSHLIMK
jgi:hypothetical protein